MRPPPTKVRVALLLVIGACGVWWSHPEFVVIGCGLAASELVGGRRGEAVESLTFVVLGAVVLVDAVRGSFNGWTPFEVFLGVCASAFGLFSLWLLRRVPRS